MVSLHSAVRYRYNDCSILKIIRMNAGLKRECITNKKYQAGEISAGNGIVTCNFSCALVWYGLVSFPAERDGDKTIQE